MNDWVPYTGPRGGKGWQHISSGEIVYGDRPGGSGQAAEPATPQSAATPWRSAGAGMWQHAQTGEVVRSKEPPSSAGTSDILAQARAGKKPTAPEPQEPARPRSKGQNDPLIQQRLSELPHGAQVLGWTKENALGMDVWSKDDEALTTAQFVDHAGADAIQQALETATPPAQSSSSEPAGPGNKASGDKTADRPFADHEQRAIENVTAIFGIAPGDVGNEQQMRLFLRRTARHVGFDPDSVPGDRTDKAVASAEFLKSRRPHLEGIVQMAKGYGWGGGSARELAHRARHAGLYLVKRAAADGHDIQGDTEQEQIAGAMQFLHGREQAAAKKPHMVQVIENVLKSMTEQTRGKRMTWWDIAMAAVGFYLGYKMVRSLQRKRRR